MIQRAIATTAVLAIVLATQWPARSRAEYPERPIKFVVGLPPGGLIDSIARIYADKLTPILGKPIIIDNRPGANGKMAEEAVAGAEPDGYTIMIGDVSRPVLMQDLNGGVPDMDMVKSFSIVGEIGSTPLIMTMSAHVGVKDFPGLVAKIKAEPGKNYSYGSVGVGSPSPVISEMLVRTIGLDVVQVPYRGGGDALNDLIAGNILWLIGVPLPVMSLIESGKVIPAFIVARERLKQLPNVPTLAELGYPQFRDERTVLFAMAPAGTPQPVMQRLNAALNKVQKDPDVRARLDKYVFVQPKPDMTLEDARAAVTRQIEAWDNAAKKAKGP